MEIRFPTYSLRELQRPGPRGPQEGDDAFVKIIGDLDAQPEAELTEHSRSAAADLAQQGSSTERETERRVSLLREAEAAARAFEGREEHGSGPADRPSHVGRRLDIIA